MVQRRFPINSLFDIKVDRFWCNQVSINKTHLGAFQTPTTLIWPYLANIVQRFVVPSKKRLQYPKEYSDAMYITASNIIKLLYGIRFYVVLSSYNPCRTRSCVNHSIDSECTQVWQDVQLTWDLTTEVTLEVSRVEFGAATVTHIETIGWDNVALSFWLPDSFVSRWSRIHWFPMTLTNHFHLFMIGFENIPDLSKDPPTEPACSINLLRGSRQSMWKWWWMWPVVVHSIRVMLQQWTNTCTLEYFSFGLPTKPPHNRFKWNPQIYIIYISGVFLRRWQCALWDGGWVSSEGWGWGYDDNNDDNDGDDGGVDD